MELGYCREKLTFIKTSDFFIKKKKNQIVNERKKVEKAVGISE